MKNRSLSANLVVLVITAAVLVLPAPAVAATPIAEGFQYPVGDGTVRQPRGDGDGWYVSSDFGDARGSGVHVGEDWNADSGSNSDYGEPVLAAAAGTIRYADDPGGGWGKVMLVEHQLPDGRRVTTQYAHLAAFVRRSGTVRRGEKIATVGTGGGRYIAHLHFELRTDPALAAKVGGTERSTKGWTDPSQFIDAHRRLTFDADAPALAVDADGRAYLAAMRQDGSVFLRRWSRSTGWSSFVRQGAAGSWSRASGIALAASGSHVLLAAVTSSGTLRVRSFVNGAGGEWRTLGSAAVWSTDAGLTMAARTGGIVLSAVRRDGSLYSASWSAARGWAGLVRQGAAGSWATGAAPELVWNGRQMLLFGVARDARVRWRPLGGAGFVALDRGRWSTDAGLAATRVGDDIVLSGVRLDGTLYTRRRAADGTWSALTRHGAELRWSKSAAPSVVTSGTAVTLFAVTAGGTLVSKQLVGGAQLQVLGPRSEWSPSVGLAGARLPTAELLLSSIRRDGALYTWTSNAGGASSALSEQGTSGSWAG